MERAGTRCSRPLRRTIAVSGRSSRRDEIDFRLRRTAYSSIISPMRKRNNTAIPSGYSRSRNAPIAERVISSFSVKTFPFARDERASRRISDPTTRKAARKSSALMVPVQGSAARKKAAQTDKRMQAVRFSARKASLSAVRLGDAARRCCRRSASGSFVFAQPHRQEHGFIGVFHGWIFHG